jgi:AcrR family transcriptional regulator
MAREEIVTAATGTLLRTGVAGFTLDAVARDLGLTKPGLYYHFASKEALVFAVCLKEWTELAAITHLATSGAATAADALEALIRTYVDRYRGRLALFKLVTQEVTSSPEFVTPEDLKAVRPLNDQFYGPTEALLRAEAGLAKGRVDYHPRRLAFIAHTAAMGLLAMKSMVESVRDPLKHSDEDLLDELCRTFRRAVE